MPPDWAPACQGLAKTTLSFLLFSGFCSCVRFYHFIEEPLTWHDAKSYCRSKFNDLAKTVNYEQMQQMMAAAGEGFEGEVWLGRLDRPHWSWSLSDNTSYESGEYGFRTWRSGEPNFSDNPLCVSTRDGQWSDHNCSTLLPFVCYNNSKTLNLSATDPERYSYINQSMTWWNARSYCREHYTDLVSVRNVMENQLITSLIPTGTEANIGLYRSFFVWWSDGSSSQYSYWAAGNPQQGGESCVASVINPTFLGRWVQKPCEEKRPFVCFNDDMRHFMVKVAVKSAIDLNDPAVAEAIQKAMADRIKENGITENVKVYWRRKPDGGIFHTGTSNANAEPDF